MKLRQYFEENSINITQFCKKNGLNVTTLYSILKGRDLYLSLALKIEDLTEGAVTAQDLRPQQTNKRARKGATPRLQ